MVPECAEEGEVSEVETKKIGRPSIKTPELIDEICARIAEGRSLLSISKDEDMPAHSAIWRWMGEDEVFKDKYARAIQTRAINHAEELTETIRQAKSGELPPDVARVAIDGMKWVASRLLPKVYGDKQIVEANVTHTHQLHLDALRALSARRSGNDLGYIDAQAIDITGDPTFSGERSGVSMPAIEVVPVSEDAEIPPTGVRAGGADAVAHTAIHTDEKPSDPLPPGKPKRRPAKKLKIKK